MIDIFSEMITLREVPWEISYTFFCRCMKSTKCSGCSWKDNDKEEYRILMEEHLLFILEKYKGKCTCITFLAEGGDIECLEKLLHMCVDFGFKTCLYTGEDSINKFEKLFPYLNYFKFGSYKEELGALNSATTNQQFWIIEDGKFKERITNYELWK